MAIVAFVSKDWLFWSLILERCVWRIWRAKLAAFCWQLLAPKCSLCTTRLYLKRQYKHMSKPGRWRTRSLVFEREKWILVAAIAHEINWNKLANSKQNNGNTQQLETVPISSSNLTRWCYNCNADTSSKQAPSVLCSHPSHLHARIIRIENQAESIRIPSPLGSWNWLGAKQIEVFLVLYLSLMQN